MHFSWSSEPRNTSTSALPSFFPAFSPALLNGLPPFNIQFVAEAEFSRITILCIYNDSLFILLYFLATIYSSNCWKYQVSPISKETRQNKKVTQQKVLRFRHTFLQTVFKTEVGTAAVFCVVRLNLHFFLRARLYLGNCLAGKDLCCGGDDSLGKEDSVSITELTLLNFTSQFIKSTGPFKRW